MLKHFRTAHSMRQCVAALLTCIALSVSPAMAQVTFQSGDDTFSGVELAVSILSETKMKSMDGRSG